MMIRNESREEMVKIASTSSRDLKGQRWEVAGQMAGHSCMYYYYCEGSRVVEGMFSRCWDADWC